jgi:hypothetical protein
LCIAALSSSCGGGEDQSEAGSPQAGGLTRSSEGKPAYPETCVTGISAFLSANGTADDPVARGLAEGYCTQAAARGLLSDKYATWEDLAPILRQNLDLLDPLCVRWGRLGFEQLPASALGEIEITSAEWGRQFCRAFFEGDYVGSDGTIATSELSEFIQDHPELYKPLMVAGLMNAYDSSFGVSRQTFRQVADRAISEALARGIFTAKTLTQYEVDQDRFQQLFLDVLQDYSSE